MFQSKLYLRNLIMLIIMRYTNVVTILPQYITFQQFVLAVITNETGNITYKTEDWWYETWTVGLRVKLTRPNHQICEFKEVIVAPHHVFFVYFVQQQRPWPEIK